MNEQTVIDLARYEHLDRQRRSAAGRARPARITLRRRAGRTLVRWGSRLAEYRTVPVAAPTRRLVASAR